MATKWIGHPKGRPGVGADMTAADPCPACGGVASDHGESVIKRGAVTVAANPTAIWWRGVFVPLSQVEADVFAFVVRRGRVLFTDVDEQMSRFGAKPATRSLVMGHIRRKFLALGACDPFERLGNTMVRLRVDADESGSSDLVVGLRMPRYARVSRESANDRR
jgi:hypothetical protein